MAGKAFVAPVLPDYHGRGLANLVPTIERHFGLASDSPSLTVDILPPALLAGVEVIATLLIDSLGYGQLIQMLTQESLPTSALLRNRADAHLAPLTSIFPSTTVAALTTLGTGLPPSRHGIVAEKLYDSRLGVILGVMGFTNILTGRVSPPTEVDPAAWVGAPTVYERLASIGIPAVVIDHADYQTSPLSRINYRGAHLVGHHSITNLCARLRTWIIEGPRPAYIHAYWGNLDTVGHRYGAGSAQYSAEIHIIIEAIEQTLLDGLTAPRTLLLVLADHGQIDLPAERWVWLNDHPELLALLQTFPTGDHRAVVLHVRPGSEAAARRYLERRLAHCTYVLSVDEVLALELYGPGPISPAIRQRMGQLLVLARDDWAIRFEYPGKERLRWQIGTHGGLSRQEMLVPLLALRLD